MGCTPIVLRNGKVLHPFKDIFDSSYRSNNTVYRERELIVQDMDGYLI